MQHFHNWVTARVRKERILLGVEAWLLRAGLANGDPHVLREGVLKTQETFCAGSPHNHHAVTYN
ncbi:hypothetical protein [Paraburkholderia nodosa]|uniref:hypothetical protein n=1 Tax=Paraburkholderia nodosa TaxID=392320 RepID=UPI000841F503|nr:hypothetical protein [Paraburkholderia nodosa]